MTDEKNLNTEPQEDDDESVEGHAISMGESQRHPNFGESERNPNLGESERHPNFGESERHPNF